MDFVNKLSEKAQGGGGGGGENQGEESKKQEEGGGGGFMSRAGDKLNTAAGGGKESEKDEDRLDKGVDMFQEKVMKKGPQDDESAVEQAKDEKISDFVRDKYKSTTGKEFPGQDK